MEACADGSDGNAYISGPGSMVLSPERNNHAISIYAEYWYEEPVLPEYLAPNLVAEAAKDFGFTDDRVRLALPRAALRDGKKVGEWEVAAEVGAAAADLEKGKLLERAKSPEVEKRARAATKDFHSLQVTQRPTFVIDTEIGDRAVFSGFARVDPLASALDSVLDDAAAYTTYAAHFGAPPA